MRRPEHVGIVVIGRNEGERLGRCLASLAGRGPVVYVDSGSVDGSRTLARETGATVEALDPARPFTAARARNAGFARLVALHPEVDAVQFVDGDCEMDSDWLGHATAALAAHPDAAVVCGRRREQRPEASLWNRLCDIEWNTPPGLAETCGGDFLIRREAFAAVGGFVGSMIAGEEPELCIRLRAGGWSIRRIEAEMTRHDADMHAWRQWWRRSVRTGHAYAETAWRHGRASGSLGARPVRSTVAWAGALPAVALLGAPLSGGTSLLLLAGYGALCWRIRRGVHARVPVPADRTAYALFCVLGKFAQAAGMLRFLAGRLRGRDATLIEYKGADLEASAGATGGDGPRSRS